jgi:integration host factor subunit alpha
MALTKCDIVDQIQVQLGFPKNKSGEVTESLLEILKSTLASGDDVLVSGFGKFCVRNKKARKGRNPATNQAMMLKARRVVTFKCSTQLRDKVNGKHKRRRK